jgi:type VI secretion system secreted protein Hcp
MSPTSLAIFAQIDGIPGDATDEKFVNQIPVQNFSFASKNSVATGTGKVITSPITFTAAAGPDSPLLIMALAKGTVLKSAVFSFVHSSGDGQFVFEKYTLSNCSIKSFHQTASESGVVVDEVQISFTQVTYTFTPQKADGTPGSSISVTWDLKTNTVA